MSIIALVVGILSIVAVEASSIGAADVLVRRAELNQGRDGLVHFSVPATPASYRQMLALHTAYPEDTFVVANSSTRSPLLQQIDYLGSPALWKPFTLVRGHLQGVFANQAAARMLSQDCTLGAGRVASPCQQLEGVVTDNRDSDGQVYAPLVSVPEGAMTVYYRPRSSDPVSETVALARSFGLTEARTPGQINVKRDIEPIIRIIRAALMAAGLVTLAVGVLGVLNIGLSTLATRATELALRRCLGATRLEIATLVMYDALIVGVAGSALALAIATLGYRPLLIAVIGAAPSGFPLKAAVIGIAVGVLSGFVGGLLPAIRAGKIQLAEVMRG